jgi:hypothetical protein
MIPWMVVAVQLAWMVFAAFLGASGFLSNWDALPPRLPFLPLGCLIVFILIGRTGFVRQGLKHVSIVGPILFQSMRILVESGFWWLHCEGQAPVQVTWKGVNHDLWAGISAPVMAMAVYLRWIRVDRTAGMLTVLVWNLLGLGLLMSAIFSIASSVPGPIFLGWSTGSFPSIVHWPAVWVASFLAPSVVFVHIFSIRQCLLQRNTLRQVEASMFVGRTRAQ